MNIKILAGSLLLFTACQQAPEKQTESQTPAEQMQPETDNAAYQPLQNTLDERKANFNAKASDEKKRIYAEGLAAIEESNIIENAINVGDNAPNFTLKNATGQEVSLADYLAKGPVVLTWYRGGWCPYCNLTLARLQEELPNFEAEGAHLLALTPEQPDSSMTTAEKHELTFEILSDLDNQIAREYGIVFKLTPEVAEIYENSFGLSDYNGNENSELPLAATYVIDTDGTITYAFLDIDYRNRAEPKAIVEALQKIN